MIEIDVSTLLLISEDEYMTRVITKDDELLVNNNVNKIVNESCKFFGFSLKERISMSKRLINSSSKVPIIIEETRNIIFFPLSSPRKKENIWVSFNNLKKYEKIDKKTRLFFENGKEITINFSYYIVDNQITRCLMLNYALMKKRKSLEK